MNAATIAGNIASNPIWKPFRVTPATELEVAITSGRHTCTIQVRTRGELAKAARGCAAARPATESP